MSNDPELLDLIGKLTNTTINEETYSYTNVKKKIPKKIIVLMIILVWIFIGFLMSICEQSKTIPYQSNEEIMKKQQLQDILFNLTIESERILSNKLNDPSSYQRVSNELDFYENGDYSIKLEFRAKNVLGVLILHEYLFTFDNYKKFKTLIVDSY
jgi:hypothetical protein